MQKKEMTDQERFDRFENLLLAQKKALTFMQACTYTGFKPSYMYKLTSQGRIPFYKPQGKAIFFDLDELSTWCLSNRNKPQSEIDAEATRYVTLNKK